MTAEDGARVRPFRAGDLPALQEIRSAAFAPAFRSFRDIVGGRVAEVALAGAEEEQARLLDALCAGGPARNVLVAEARAMVVGFVTFTVEGRSGEIGLNAVHPDHAGAGVGTRLYLEALERMKAAGVAVAAVSTGGDPSHAPARRAYEKAGFGTPIPSLTLYRRL